MNKLKKIIFLIPPYHQSSNGIKVLYEAAYLFSKVIATRILIFDPKTNDLIKLNVAERSNFPMKYKFLYSDNSHMAVDSICIYPEILILDPLPHIQKKIVRYFLAKPYQINGQSPNFESDFSLSYSKIVSKNFPQLFILDSNLKKLKKIHVKKRNKATVYFGKYRPETKIDYFNLDNLISLFDEVKIITRTEPASTKELYYEVASSKLLISYDGMTSLIYESILMGTPCLILDDLFKKEMNDFNVPHNDIYFSRDISMLKKLLLKDSNLNNKRETNIKNYEIAIEKQMSDVKATIKLISNFFTKSDVIQSAKNRQKNKKERKAFESFYSKNFKSRPVVNVTKKNRILLILLLNYSPYFYEKLICIFSEIKKYSYFIALKHCFFNPFRIKIDKKLFICLQFLAALVFKIKLSDSKIIRLVNQSAKNY